MQQKPAASLFKKEKPKLIIPKASWDDDYFGSKHTRDRQSIKGRATLSHLSNLRDIVFPADNIEVRLWDVPSGYVGPGLQGFVLKRTGGQWAAVRLLESLPKYAASSYLETLSPPRSGWERFWNRLVREGLLTLPDSSTLPTLVPIGTDAEFYVVEINHNKTYRTYRYGNPRYQKGKEARHIVAIFDTIGREFGIHRWTND